MSEEQLALLSIYTSVLGHGDFARYILGSGNLQWSKRRLNEPRVPSAKEQRERFESSLTARQKRAWTSYVQTRWGVEFYRSLDAGRRKATFGREISEASLGASIVVRERAFRNTLGKEKALVFDNAILPYLQSSPDTSDELAFPVAMAQRWIFMRVLDLGWTPERFGAFDRYQGAFAASARTAGKPERIGKKYQWIAYHEFLAHLADNLEFREDPSSDKAGVYSGPWQLGLRDIDPSCLLTSTSRSDAPAWWAPARFDAWAVELDDVDWLKHIDLLPSIAPLPLVIDPSTGRQWFVLECFYNWEQPAPPETERYDISRRHIWYILRSYIVKEEDELRLYDWAKTQRFMGRWMPESHEQTDVFLGEFFWSHAFEYFHTSYYNRDGWTRGRRRSLPCKVLVTTDEYMQEQTGYDCSIDETISMYLPAKLIADEMKLSWRGVDGCYFGPAGDLIAQDPSLRTPGPRAFLIEKEFLSAFLNAQGYRLIWTLLGEKDVRGGFGGNENWPGRMDLSGCMRMKDGGVEGLATLFWVKQDPEHTELGKINISSVG